MWRGKGLVGEEVEGADKASCSGVSSPFLAVGVGVFEGRNVGVCGDLKRSG